MATAVRTARTSTARAQQVVFVTALAQYRRTAGLTSRELVPTRPVMAACFRQAARGALGRA